MSVRRILIVEDDPSIMEILEDLLGSEGYLVGSAADGGAALEAIAVAPPDLLLVDVMMPVLDGPGLLRTLQAAGNAIPAVLMSAGRPPDLAGLDVAGFLSKPFDIDEVLALVERLLAIQRARPA